MKPRARPEWLAAGVLSALLSGCPQLVEDEFDKLPNSPDLDSTSAMDSGETGGSAGSAGNAGSSGSNGSGGSNGTTASVDVTTTSTESVGGSSTSVSSSQGGSATSVSSSQGGSLGVGGTDSANTTDGTESSSSMGGTSPECTETDEICDGLDNDCDDEIDQDACEARCQGFAVDDHGYMFCGTLTGAPDAATFCSEHGMTLVQIDSEDENDTLVDEVNQLFDLAETSAKQPAFWTGASDEDVEAEWIWVGSGAAFWSGDGDGAAVGDAFVNWGDGKPNSAGRGPENCAVVYLISGEDGAIGTWNDLPCWDGYTFVCEAE